MKLGIILGKGKGKPSEADAKDEGSESACDMALSDAFAAVKAGDKKAFMAAMRAAMAAKSYESAEDDDD